MPYEVLFEVARFLTPEELLVARTTCRKVNNLLRAESARFWIHATLRRKLRRMQFRLRGATNTRELAQSGRANSIGRRRSLIYEAVKTLLPKLYSTR